MSQLAGEHGCGRRVDTVALQQATRVEAFEGNDFARVDRVLPGD